MRTGVERGRPRILLDRKAQEAHRLVRAPLVRARQLLQLLRQRRLAVPRPERPAQPQVDDPGVVRLLAAEAVADGRQVGRAAALEGPRVRRGPEGVQHQRIAGVVGAGHEVLAQVAHDLRGEGGPVRQGYDLQVLLQDREVGNDMRRAAAEEAAGRVRQQLHGHCAQVWAEGLRNGGRRGRPGVRGWGRGGGVRGTGPPAQPRTGGRQAHTCCSEACVWVAIFAFWSLDNACQTYGGRHNTRTAPQTWHAPRCSVASSR